MSNFIFDFHTHAFPEKIARSTIEKLSKIADSPYYGDGTLAGLRDNLAEAEASSAAVLNIATNPLKVARINDCAAENDWFVSHNGTYGRLIHFGSVHPDATDALEECERIASLGIRGVKFHPDYQNFYIDEERLFPIYEKLSSLRLPVVFHGGYDPYSPNDIHCTARRAVKVLERFPDLTVILAHMGGNITGYRESLELLCGRYENLYLDTSFCAGHIDTDLMHEMIEKQTPDKVLFGSDFPWHTTSEELRLIKSLRLAGSDEEKILGKNAASLLSFDPRNL